MTTDTQSAELKWLSDSVRCPSKTLLEIFEMLTGKKVKRFASRAAGIQRILKACREDEKVDGRLQRLMSVDRPAAATITVEDIKTDPGEPLPTVGEVLDEIAEKEAENYEVRAIDGSDLVAIDGRTVRKDNVDRVKAGEALWGRLQQSKHKVKDATGLRFDYPLKDKVVKARPGTKRAKLIEALRKGVTIKQIENMFSIDRAKAIYKLRDIHYVGGHGLETRADGKIYLIEPKK